MARRSLAPHMPIQSKELPSQQSQIMIVESNIFSLLVVKTLGLINKILIYSSQQTEVFFYLKILLIKKFMKTLVIN